MDKEMKDIDSTSSDDSDSLGSEGDGEELNNATGNKLAESDSLLDSTDSEDSDSLGGDVEDEMEVDEDALNEQLRQINDVLAANPYAYDSYVEKIQILKKIGVLDKLRETREKFSKVYPLSGALWLDWLRDEIKLACTENEKEEVEKLFERAILDYLSVDVWIEYINFRISNMDAENGQERAREVFERALGVCGLHVSMGSLIWDMYRDFEAALLGAATTEEMQQAQENRFVSLCRRQLSVPLLGIRKTYEDVKAKIDMDENTESSYKKVMARLNSLEVWEGKLIQQNDTEKVQTYRNYIEDEVKVKSNPARIQCLYERAVADYPLDGSLWLEYLEYLSKNLKIDSIIFGVAYRASRNCSWDVNVWLKYMFLVEKFSESSKAFDTMKEVFEKAITHCSVGEAAGTIWLKYLEFLRRKFDINDATEKELDILRKTFVAAEQHLSQLFPEPNEFISEVLLFRVRFETRRAKGITQDVAIQWKDIMNRGYNQYAKTWIQNILQEVSYGADVRKLRALYNKAVCTVKDDLQTLSNLWINFERDNGDLMSLQQCETTISKVIIKNATEVPVLQSTVPEPNNLSTNSVTTITRGTKRKPNSDETNVAFKRKRATEDTVDSENSSTVFKVPSVPEAKPKGKPNRGEGGGSHHGELIKHDPSKDNRTVFLSNLAFTTEEDNIRKFFSEVGDIEEIRLARDFKGRSKGFGYVFFTNVDMARKALAMDRQPIDGRPAFVSVCDPDKSTRQKQFKYATSLEKNKLFVKGLPFSFTADQLRDLFQKHGDLKDCRLVTYRNGHSKGLAYVDFIDDACASQAILKLDGMMIDDMKISVAISNPPARDSSKPSGSVTSQRSSTFNDQSQRRAPRAFVPRSLLTGIKKDSGSPANTGPKSNQDFRSMFLK